MSTDYLTDDPVIENQKFACISYITPETVKGCDKRLIKVRGLYSEKDIAENRCRELNDNTFPIGVVEVGKWIAFPDHDSNCDDPVNELNDLMKLYLEERELSKKEHEDRKSNYKEVIKNENYDTSNKIQELTDEILNIFKNNHFDKTSVIEVLNKYLSDFNHIEKGKNLDQIM